MAFPTINFAYFFAVTATTYWLLRRHRTLQKVLLLLASYYFYARWDARLLGLLVGISVLNWLVAKGLVGDLVPPWRRALAGAGISANLCLLGVFKFYDFFRTSLAEFGAFLGLSVHLPVVEIFLPIGISFYCFQGIAYLVDTYRGKAVVAPRLLDFLLFMAFFPKLLAGPICRSQDLLPQIMARCPETVPEPSYAAALIASGVFKKMVLASLLATRLVDDTFILPAQRSSVELVVAMFAYSAQVYLDFSGYTDLARGVALLLGFNIPENFLCPYAATNLGDYWRRWHITLSSWLRDYVYFPLGGSRCSRCRTCFNLIVTFGVCGLWHGARWTFVTWGLLHGIGMACYKAWLDWQRDRKVDLTQPRSRSWAILAWFTTLTYCAFARIPFRCPDMETAWEFVKGLGRGTCWGRGIDPVVLAIVVLTIALNFVGRRFFESCVRWHARVPTPLRPIVWTGTGLLLLSLKTRDVARYIYFGF